MFLVVDYDGIVGPTRTVIILLQLLMATGSVLIGCVMLQKARKNAMVRRYFIYIALFFFGLGIGRYFFIVHDFFTPGDSSIDLTPASYLKRAAVSFTILGLTSLAYLVETELFFKSRKAFTIFGIIVIIAQITMPFTIAQPLNYIGNPLLSILPLGIYIYLYVTQAGIIKKQAGVILLGILVFGIGQMFFGLLQDLFLITEATALMFSPPISLIGLMIIGYGFFRYNKGEEKVS